MSAALLDPIYDDQKPGTSGLRKKTAHFKQKNYLENFVQAMFNVLNGEKEELQGKTLVVGGDGRHYNNEAVEVIVRMAEANGVGKLVLGVDNLISTPCVSYLIRKLKSFGGIILTASHNPGGIKGDFGIKYNCDNGGPAPASVTDAIFHESKKLTALKINTSEKFDLKASSFGKLKLEVIDAPAAYSEMFSTIFDMAAIKAFVNRKGGFKMVYDSMHGVAGPFAKRLFGVDLGLDVSKVCINSEPKEDFGHSINHELYGHPDPNLTYAKELVKICGLAQNGDVFEMKDEEVANVPDLGAAADGDADRNMILGQRFFVTPSDSVAIIAANAQECIPFFKNGLKGVSRSMPTSGALDRVAEGLKLEFHEVPTGWKYFGNLMDADRIQICGEESFGTGSSHIREKDGMWAVLAWLSILAKHNPDESKPLVTVQSIVEAHWAKYGRNYYTRYDYEGLPPVAANGLMDHLRALKDNFPKDAEHKAVDGIDFAENKLAYGDEFTYTDPIDKSVASKQGIRFIFADNSRIIWRLSGTGSDSATIRLYIEKYAAKDVASKPRDALAPFVNLAIKLGNLKTMIGTETPTVIT